jgi:hypothetical protein
MLIGRIQQQAFQGIQTGLVVVDEENFGDLHGGSTLAKGK